MGVLGVEEWVHGVARPEALSPSPSGGVAQTQTQMPVITPVGRCDRVWSEALWDERNPCTDPRELCCPSQ